MKTIKATKANVLLKGTTKRLTDSGIVLPGAKSDNIDRKRYVKDVEVLSVGPDVTSCKKGDSVVVLSDTLMKLAYNVIHFLFEDDKDRAAQVDDGYFYIMVPEEEIKGVICQK